jgi:CubicO group peptidase (beta-lactamase class C family)
MNNNPMTINRRTCLATLGASLLASGSPRPVHARQVPREIPVTGEAVPGLEPFDRLMSRFVREHDIPGATLAVGKDRRVVYARGFGHADLGHQTPVTPEALFRIASVSKPITAVATLQLVERGRFGLDDPAFALLDLKPALKPGRTVDPRIEKITVRQLLQHTAGWDRDASFDPIARVRDMARTLGMGLPVTPEGVVRYSMGLPLDFDPGARMAYCNVGYLVLGRLIASYGGMSYESYVNEHVLKPMGISRAQLGHGAVSQRAEGEVSYRDRNGRSGPAVVGPQLGQTVPLPDGAENLDGFEAHGGWIASAPDLVRFASAFDNPADCPLLKPETIETMFARPEGAAGYEADGRPKAAYYACGWSVRPVRDRGRNTWHSGLIAGTSALLVRRHDGLDWAVLFNTQSTPDGRTLSGVIDPLIHRAADAVRSWPAS